MQNNVFCKLFVLLLLSRVKCSLEKIIQIESFDYLHITINIGDPYVSYYLPIDINLNKSWFIERDNNQHLSVESKIIQRDVKFFYFDLNIIGKLVEDNFNLNKNDKVVTFQYLLISTQYFQYLKDNGALGMSFKYNNTKDSFIHQYLSKGYIDQLSFGFFRNTIIGKKYFFLGSMPHNGTENKTHSYCDVIGRDSRWDCIISNAYIKYNYTNYPFEMEDNVYVYFDSVNESILFPTTFYDFLIQVYFLEAIEKGLCLIKEYNKKQLLCWELFDFTESEIVLTIGKFNYTLNINNYWDCVDDFCVFLILENSQNDDYVLGKMFFQTYNLLFNYESKQVHIYSSKGVSPFSSHVGYMVKRISYIIIIEISLFGVVIVIFIKTKGVFYSILH